MLITDETSEFEVRINDRKLTLDIYQNGDWIYDIDLETCNTSAGMLDWIMQVHSKSWCTPALLYEILTFLNIACLQIFDTTVQGAICSLGIDHRVKWPRGPWPCDCGFASCPNKNRHILSLVN